MNTSTFEIITLAESDTSNPIHKYVLFDQPFIDIVVAHSREEVSDFSYGDEFVFDMFHECKATHIIMRGWYGDGDMFEHKFKLHFEQQFVTTVGHIHNLKYNGNGEALLLVLEDHPEVWFYAEDLVKECMEHGVDEIEVVMGEGEK